MTENVILKIKNFVKAKTGVTRKEMSGQSRRQKVVFARHVAMYLCRKYTTHSYPEIGRAFSKDHSSAIHAVQKIEKHFAIGSTLPRIPIIDEFRELVVSEANNLVKLAWYKTEGIK